MAGCQCGSDGSSVACTNCAGTCWNTCGSDGASSSCATNCSATDAGCHCGSDCQGCGGGCTGTAKSECDCSGCSGSCGSGCSGGCNDTCSGGCGGTCDVACVSGAQDALYEKLLAGLSKKILAYDLENINSMIQYQAERRSKTTASQSFTQKDKAISNKIKNLQSNLNTIGYPTTQNANQQVRTQRKIGQELIDKALDAYREEIPHD